MMNSETFVTALQQDTRYKIQEALFNVGLHENLITLAHLSYFPTNKCKATKHTEHTEYFK